MSIEKQFNKLRARYLAQCAKVDEFDSMARGKYGPNWKDQWLSRLENNRLDRLRAAKEKAGTILFEYIQSISPRDWSYGVPAYWVREKLTFADVMRPVNETLSVVPPLSHGSTVPRV